MTINVPTFGMAKSVWPKIFGGIAVVATLISYQYHGSLYQIAGMFAFEFWNMIALAAVALSQFVVREDGKSSEQVGAGIIPRQEIDTVKIQAQIDALQKQLTENK